MALVPVVVGLEGARLVEPHVSVDQIYCKRLRWIPLNIANNNVLCLLVGELGEMGLEGGEVERGDELVHQLGHQIDVGLVPARGRVEQLCNGLRLNHLSA